MKRTSDDAEKYEIRSAYSKIGPWLEENKGVINRKQKKGADGKMVDKKASLIPTVKAIIFQQSKIKGTPYEELSAAIRYIVEEVMGLTPSTFYNKYDTVFLKEFKIYPAVMNLIDNAPESVQIECCFNHKDILFKSLWPDFYEKNLAGSITAHDILFAENGKKDMFKSNIIRAGQVKNITSKDKGTKFGALVDEMLFDAITEDLYQNGTFQSIKELFQALGALSVATKKDEMVGGNEIAISRGYKSILDFYYLNLPDSIQIAHARDFLNAREESGLAPEPMLEIMILAKLRDFDGLQKYGFLSDEKQAEEDSCDSIAI